MAGPNIEPFPGLLDAKLKAQFPTFNSRLKSFQDWLTLQFVPRAQQAPPVIVHPVGLADQSASIGTTALIGAASAGLYRVTCWVHIVQAATVSSSLTPTVSTVDRGFSVSQSGAAVTGNTTGTGAGFTFDVRCDAGAILSYTTTYVSVGGTVMKYDVEWAVEAL